VNPPAQGAGTPPPPPTTPPPASTSGNRPGIVPIVPVPSAPAAPPPAQPPAGGAQVAAVPPGTQFDAGKSYAVPLAVSGVSQLGTMTLTVSYNPAVLRVTKVDEGTFLKQGGVATTFTPTIDAQGGRVTLVISRPATAATGASGDGILAMLTFEAVAPGSSAIALAGSAGGPGGQPAVALRFAPVTITVK
jgi:hypothetical protein